MDCIFCKIVNKEISRNIVYEDALVVVIMDANPAVDGHLLVIPKKHYTDYTELDKEISGHLFYVAQKLRPNLMEAMKAKSLTLLMNYGDDQKVKHVHLHMLPDFGSECVKKAKRSIKENYNLITNKL